MQARFRILIASLVLAAILLLACGTVWADNTGEPGQGGPPRSYYDPFQYTKDPPRWKAPPVPNPYSEDKSSRYYSLTDFRPNEKNLPKIFRNTDEHKKPLSFDGKPLQYGLCYISKGDLENFVEYWLAGRFKTFEVTLTVPDNFQGKLYYYVYGDDKKLLQGDDLGKDRKSAHITLSVEGVRRLVLKTAGNKTTEKLRIVWANPILTESKEDE